MEPQKRPLSEDGDCTKREKNRKKQKHCKVPNKSNKEKEPCSTGTFQHVPLQVIEFGNMEIGETSKRSKGINKQINSKKPFKPKKDLSNSQSFVNKRQKLRRIKKDPLVNIVSTPEPQKRPLSKDGDCTKGEKNRKKQKHCKVRNKSNKEKEPRSTGTFEHVPLQVIEFGNMEIGETSKRSKRINKQINSKKPFKPKKDLSNSQSFVNKTQKLRRIKKDPLLNIVSTPDLLAIVPDCEYCKARRIYLEPPSFCCGNGQIKLTSTEMPNDLLNLYTQNSELTKHFRECIRSYNNMFAFTSLGVHYDKSLARRTSGIYTFRVQGQLHHFMEPLMPISNQKPVNLQLYFYDTDHEIQNRLSISVKFKKAIVEALVTILHRNPYTLFFRSLNSYCNLNDYKIILQTDPTVDQHVYNKPTVSQVAGIWLESNDEQANYNQQIQVYPKQGRAQIIQHYYGCYDPLQYPLIFPNGDPGWHRKIARVCQKKKGYNTQQLCDGENSYHIENFTDIENFLSAENERYVTKHTKKQMVTCREYYCYKLQIRETDSSYLLHTGRLLQQYVIDMYIKIETSRLNFLRSNEIQNQLRSEIYLGLLDGIAQGCKTGGDVGKHIILPHSFIGGPRDIRRRYMDCISLVQRFGKPDIFLTITSNPSWPEITTQCLKSDESQNRPDLVTRIFRAKLEMLKKELFKKRIFGKVIAYTYVIEFQKRGLPHAHFLLILDSASKLYSPDAFDKIVCAEIPDASKEQYLHSLVTKHMMHGPCGNLNPFCSCMKKNSGCKFNYPKNFSETTMYGIDSYPTYRRRNNGIFVTVRGKDLNNQWVVPYNPYLLAKFNCHINVEICSTIQVVKYIYKYIYKGHDKILYNLTDKETTQSVNEEINDEITNFQRARWISAPEAMWRIFAFDLNQINPPVITLPIHLENQQCITFPAHKRLGEIINNPTNKKTMLTEFFKMNKCNEHAQRLNCLYIEFPEHFTWHQDLKKWQPRQRQKVIGRITTCRPYDGERFYLRLLLLHIRKPTSFTEIRTINNDICDTYRQAVEMLGLIEKDDASEVCLEEAATYMMPSALRQLFATVIVFCNPQNVEELWIKFQQDLCHDFSNNERLPQVTITNKVLNIISDHIYVMGKKPEDYPFLTNYLEQPLCKELTKELNTEMNVTTPAEDVLAIAKLNVEQKAAYDNIMYHVNNNIAKAFFIDGPGGTGKIFLYKSLLATVRNTKNIALATATSGVAASLLPGGRTAHSRFKIPLNDNNTSCNISKQSSLALLLKKAKLIIWDEATMAHRKIIEKLNEMLQDIMNTNQIFGGKVIVFGGDFRQTLPVIASSTKADIIDASIIKSPIWDKFEKLRLKQNMRASLDQPFSNYLLNIGNGIEQASDEANVEIPNTVNIPFDNDDRSLNLLIDLVFPNISTYLDPKKYTNKAILSTRNDFVHEINEYLIDKFPGKEKIYLSYDESINTSMMIDEQELFHCLTPQGLPPHKLKLKKNAPIILLRNINPTEGLCNGTRLICKEFNKNVIYAQISTGPYEGKPMFIPRITLEAPQNNLSSIPFKRKQFPIRLCFAMTINKAQGQTLDFVGIYLKEPVFSHGQLYVALSRARTINELKVLIRPSTLESKASNQTKNIVYKEILSASNII